MSSLAKTGPLDRNGPSAEDVPAALRKRPAFDAFMAALPAICAEIEKDAIRRERDRVLPFEAVQRLRDAGIGLLRVPQDLGGPGATVAELLEIVAQVAAADSNVAHALRSHFNFVETVLLSADQTGRYLPAILAGRIYGGAHTERGTARPGEIRTRLVHRADHYRLDGTKYYATGAIFTDRILVSAVDENGLAAIVEIEPGRTGVSFLDDWDGMGQRLTSSGSLKLDDVRVELGDVDWQEETERQDAAGRHAATFRQLYLAACITGIVRNTLSDAIAYVQLKARPITHGHAESSVDDLFVQRTVGLISAKLFAIDALLAKTAEGIDHARQPLLTGKQDTGDKVDLTASALNVARAQSVIGELALSAATSLLDTGGGSATSRDLSFDRHWRNIRAILNHNPIDYKLKAVGAFELKAESPPLKGGFF